MTMQDQPAVTGTPLPIISRQLGHANAGTTGLYLRGLSDEEVVG